MNELLPPPSSLTIFSVSSSDIDTEIEKRLGKVACGLKLPSSSQIYPFCHVSFLKKKIGDDTEPVTMLPVVDNQGKLRAEPIAILDKRMVRKGNHAAIQWLIHSTGQRVDEAT
ncbi:hypothetical protein ACH5RR_008442 [Cinchona calisaya]|uniref:Uncharacterized protein n=1 Tax=Cinchona calisaya TaxID=153742 RepID=A0ABD3AF01_9GENT